MELATTGISGLDAQLGGGFPRGSTVLVISEPSNALNLFAEQFCAGGLIVGERVLYGQFDQPTLGVADRIRDLAKHLGGLKGEIQVFDGYGPQFGANGAGGGAKDAVPLSGDDMLGQLLHHASEAAKGTPYRMTVDSLSGITRPGKDAEVVDFVRRLVHMGHLTGGLHLLTLVKGMHDPALETRLKHLCTGVLEMGLERKGFGLYNFLQISKMLDLKDPTRLLLFKETDKGLWLESTKRVF